VIWMARSIALHSVSLTAHFAMEMM
jgi:hypothetical protein